MNPRQVYRDILDNSQFGALATASLDGRPEVATIFFAYSEGSFFFKTQSDYRKYENLKSNPRVALAITDDERTVQVEGVARELDNPAKAVLALDAKRGGPSSRAHLPSSCYFCLDPDWVRVMVDSGPPARFHVLDVE